MFTQACFIRKNSKELQDKVYRLGGRSGTCIWESEFNTLLVADKDHFRCYDNEWGNSDSLIKIGCIDCGTNSDLFIALAALMDDSDKNQWFTDGDNWVLCEDIKFSSYWVYNNINVNLDTIHKATVEELIEHFKEK